MTSTSPYSTSFLITSTMTEIVTGVNDTNTDVEHNALTWESIIYITIAAFGCLTTAVANIILIILVLVDTKLRRYKNYYIINLAFADLLVGIFVMPMFSSYFILHRWPFGVLTCEIWMGIDLICVSVSILSICLISADRYLAITQPLKHLSSQRRKRAILSIAVIWVFSVAFWVISLLAHKYSFFGGSLSVVSECIFLPELPYVVGSTLVMYIFPMAFMVALYARVISALKGRLLDKTFSGKDSTTGTENKLSFSRKIFCCCERQVDGDSTSPSNISVIDAKGIASLQTIMVDCEDVYRMPTSDICLPQRASPGQRLSAASSTDVDPASREELTQSTITTGNQPDTTIPVGRSNRSPEKTLQMSGDSNRGYIPDDHQVTQVASKATEIDQAKDYGKALQEVRHRQLAMSRLRDHQRTARTLGVIIVAFLLCVLPYTIMLPVNSYCNCIPNVLFTVSFWTIYLNSTVNPFLYGFNKDFRDGFRRLVGWERRPPPQSLTSSTSIQ